MTDPWGNPLPEGVELTPNPTAPPTAPAASPPTAPPPPPAPPAPSANPAWPGRASERPLPLPPPPIAPPTPPGSPTTDPSWGTPQWGDAPPPARTSGMAIASMVCGIVGMLCFGIVLCPTAIGLSIAARRAITRDPSLRGGGMATAGMVLGIIGTILAIVAMVWLLKNPEGLQDLFTTTTTTGLNDA